MDEQYYFISTTHYFRCTTCFAYHTLQAAIVYLEAGDFEMGVRAVNFTCMTVPARLVKNLFIRRERDVYLRRVGHLVPLTGDL